MGRRTKLSPEVQQRICECLRKGHYAKTAAVLAGISEPTLYTWLERGEAGEEPYAAFRDAIEEANAEAEDMLLETVISGGPSMALQVLQRRFAEHWRDTTRHEHAGVKGDPVRLEHSTERSARVLERLAEAGALSEPQRKALEAGGG